MKRAFIIFVFLVFMSINAWAYGVGCDYETGKQICNGYIIKKECENKDIDLPNVLMMGNYYPWLNNTAKKEYQEGIKCIEVYVNEEASRGE